MLRGERSRRGGDEWQEGEGSMKGLIVLALSSRISDEGLELSSSSCNPSQGSYWRLEGWVGKGAG